jgi:hypothetical protein
MENHGDRSREPPQALLGATYREPGVNTGIGAGAAGTALTPPGVYGSSINRVPYGSVLLGTVQPRLPLLNGVLPY